MKRLPDDPRFKHVNLYHTNLHVTFARIRRDLAAAKPAVPDNHVVELRPTIRRRTGERT